MIYDLCSALTLRKDFFWNLLVEHLEISLLAIIIAVCFGGLVGILISEFQCSAKPTLNIINFLYTIPSISMLGFLIPFSGVGNTTAVIALTTYALLPMVRNTHTGITNIDPNILEAARGMGSTRFQILFKIKLPLAMPVIMSGIRSMVTMTIALAGIASFIGAGGLGVAIYRGITTNNTAMTMAGSLLIAILAIVMDLILSFVEWRWSLRSRKAQKHTKLILVTAAILGLVLLSFASFSGKAKEPLRIATKPMTEQYILGEMLSLLIEQDTDLKVKLTQGVGGGTSNIHPAMVSGEFDIYPEYTGTGWNMVLKQSGIYSENLFPVLQQKYQNDLNMQWLGMYGFNNTFGLAVRREIAEKYALKNYADLAKVAPELVFGAEYDFFEREDGYPALVKGYGFKFGKTMDLDIGLKYKAIEQNKIDVMIIFTTDGQLSTADLVVLQDNNNFFPSYMCGNIIRTSVLQAHPELNQVFTKLTGIITDADMVKMNHAVEKAGQEPHKVAKEYLRTKNLLR